MDKELLAILKEGADDIFIESLKYLSQRDYTRHYRSMSLARAINHYLERTSLLKKCNEFLFEGMRKRGHSKEEIEKILRYGEEKTEFLIELSEGRQDFLDKKIKKQKPFEDYYSEN